MGTAVVIVAGGSGLRAGGERPKQYQEIAGRPVIRHTLDAFVCHPGIELVQVVIGEGHEDLYAAATEGLILPPPVYGGRTRQESVRNGLEALPASIDKVLIHDAARPFVSNSLISHVIAYLDRHPAVIPGLPVVDTLKRAEANIILGTADRTGLWAAQTPQAFRFPLILQAHRHAASAPDIEFTDDASIAEWAGIEVAIIPGSPDNRKITTADDLREADLKMLLAEELKLLDHRVGQGFDVHSFEPGKGVTLCGVFIPHTHKLSGHSDADAALHALTDAILGSIGEGDIGVHFPPSDPQWKGADSAIFLKHALALVKKRGGRIGNADITIVAEAPKVSPHVEKMRETLAALLEIYSDRVAIKATTSEKMGFTGRREGLCAFATCLVKLPLDHDKT
ncbi:MAG: bifunctional 2-C-methyl-D-erythritol 4-phosphate cytidylyltransferase/2-C-methyl-D-erythritol 2,4-cyclodiphosphate synthase [Hyphomicrobiales bacterium]